MKKRIKDHHGYKCKKGTKFMVNPDKWLKIPLHKKIVLTLFCDRLPYELNSLTAKTIIFRPKFFEGKKLTNEGIKFS